MWEIKDIEKGLISHEEGLVEIKTTVTCGICYFDISTADQTTLTLHGCSHFFCKECIGDYFKSLVVDQMKDHMLKCPEHGCQNKPSLDQIRLVLDADAFAKYEQFSTNRRVITDPNLLFCSKIGCRSILRKSDGKKKLVKCEDCSSKTCCECKNEYHGNGSCEAADQDRYANWAGGLVIHKCPKCGCQVEKNEGCSHMICIICNYSWCWICGM